MATFKDHFSKHSDIYAKYRPQYPASLFTYLSSLTPHHELAWDCGAGNGQAAAGLTDYYDTIIATEPSVQQIQHAIQHHNIIYRPEKAEHTSFASHSVDLLTIANALHWFDFELFYTEVHRVLKKDGVIAAWAYKLPVISPEVDQLVRYLHDDILYDYWRAENRLVEKGYTTIPFPFQRINAPDFYIEKQMHLQDLLGFLHTWSALQRYMHEHKTNPLDTLHNEFISAWAHGDPQKNVRWKLMLKLGRIT